MWPCAGNWIVCVVIFVPVSSRMTKVMVAGCVETFASATLVTNPLVLSNHSRYAGRLRLCKGTTACCCCCCAVTLSVKTAKPLTSPSLSSWAQPVASGLFRPAVRITSPAPAFSGPVNVESVTAAAEVCGNVTGNGNGLPLLSKQLRATFAGAAPLFNNVNVVVHWPPPEAK